MTIEGSDATIGSSDATIGGSDATIGGSDATIGGSDATIGGSDATIGGSDATIGGSDATIGGSDATIGGSDATIEGSDVAIAASGGGVVISKGMRRAVGKLAISGLFVVVVPSVAFAQQNPCTPPTHMRPAAITYSWIAWSQQLDGLRTMLDHCDKPWMDCYHEWFTSPAGKVGHSEDERKVMADAMDKLGSRLMAFMTPRCPVPAGASIDSTPIRMAKDDCWASKDWCLSNLASAVANLQAAVPVSQCVDEAELADKWAAQDAQAKQQCDDFKKAEAAKAAADAAAKKAAEEAAQKKQQEQIAAQEKARAEAAEKVKVQQAAAAEQKKEAGAKVAQNIQQRWNASQQAQANIQKAGQQLMAALGVDAALGPDLDLSALQPELAALGQWIESLNGKVWVPSPKAAGPGFVPYASKGRWQYSDLGWTWASDYPWGWAAFHYGSWTQVKGQWAWVPGTTWGPAWVSWSGNDGYVGWAPLGPKGAPAASAYVYAKAGRFTAADVGEHLLARKDVGGELRGLPSPAKVQDYPVSPVNAGPRPELIEKASGRPIQALPIAAVAGAAPPANHPGLRAPAGSATPFATRPLSGAASQQFVDTQPKEARQSFQPEAAVHPWTRREGGDTRAFAGSAAVAPAPAVRPAPVTAPPAYAPAARPAPSYAPPAAAPSFAAPAVQPSYRAPTPEPSFRPPPAEPSYRPPPAEPSYREPTAEPSYRPPAAEPSYKEPTFRPANEEPSFREPEERSFRPAEEERPARGYEPERERAEPERAEPERERVEPERERAEPERERVEPERERPREPERREEPEEEEKKKKKW